MGSDPKFVFVKNGRSLNLCVEKPKLKIAEVQAANACAPGSGCC